MRLPRPYIPLKVRLQVAWRQLEPKPRRYGLGYFLTFNRAERLRRILSEIFTDDVKVHLDHDPPLFARLKIRDKNGAVIGYSPAANDPDFLVYRAKEDHRVKTYVRGEHGQYSDTVLIKRERKREKKKAGKVRKYRWPKRKLKSRSFHAAITSGHGE
jgi:hypothetical protein